MRKTTLFLLTFLCTCGLALNLSAQCAIEVIIVDVTCSDAGGPSILIDFRVEGTGGSQWTSPTLNVSGAYNTGTLYSAGPFPGEFIENVLFQDANNGACFTVIDRIEADCGPNCTAFEANAEREEVLFCESGEFWFLNARNGTYPVEVAISTDFGDTLLRTLTVNQASIQEFFNVGFYTVTMTDANGCRAETEFFAEAHPCSSIVGRSWRDENNNGLQDENETTPAAAFVALIGTQNQPAQTAVTDANGVFRFDNLLAGEYRMVIESGDSLALTLADVGDDPAVNSDFRSDNNSTSWFLLEGGQTRTDLDAGWRSETCDSLSIFQGQFVIPCDADSVLVSPDTIIEGFTYRWFGPQNEVIEGATFFATRPAFYSLRANNDNGCAITGWASINSNDLDDQFIEIFEFNQDSTCGEQTCFGLETTLNPNSELDFTIVWEGPNEEFNEFANEDPFRFICTLFPGLYRVTVTTACDTVVRSLFVEDFVGCSSISGRLWLDQAADCGLDAEDAPVPNYVIMLTDASGSVYYALTDAQGNWSAELPLGTYAIEPTLSPGAPFGTCSPPVSVALGNSPVSGVDVFLPVAEQCPQLTTDVSMPFLRRCFSSNAWVDYENIGAVTATDAELVVTLDDFFTDVTANANFTRDGNTYTFQLGDLPPFAAGQIFFSFIVSCDANLGQSHCIEANIKPDEPCGETENWDGALVTVDALGCDGDSVTFLVTNIGEGQMSVPLSYVIVEDGIMLSPAPLINGLLEADQVMEIAVPATGGTYHLITNQEPNAPADSMPTAVIEGCEITGGNGFSTGFTNILPLTNGQRTTSVVCRENVGSYDPNDKNGYPLGFEGNNIFPGTRLDYAIRFQNTGTDTAFTVVIRDTIARSLDLATLKFESASHDYTVTLDTHRVLTFVFENILLPDSSVNLAGSQGVVNFSIDHDSSLVAGDVILNDAAIYFDFNEPIITNLSRHVIAKDGLPVSTRAAFAQRVALSVFPNPTDGLLNVSIPATNAAPEDVLTVTDLYGRELARTTYASAANGWNLQHLPAGYYVLVLLDHAGRARGRAGFVRR